MPGQIARNFRGVFLVNSLDFIKLVYFFHFPLTLSLLDDMAFSLASLLALKLEVK